MTSLQGIYPFFDYEFTYPSSVSQVLAPPCQTLTQLYHPRSHTIFGYLSQHYPNWTFIVKLAKMDQVLNDLQFQGTMFLPPDDALPYSPLIAMDIGQARHIVLYHLLQGVYSQSMLVSSYAQSLTTMLPFQRTLLFQSNGQSEAILNNVARVIEWDLRFANGIIHKISHLVPLNEKPSCP